MVIAVPSPGNREAVESLVELGLPVVVVEEGPTLDDIYASIEKIAAEARRPAEGRELIARLRGQVDAVRRRVAPLRRVRVLMINLILVFLSLETNSICLYILTGYLRDVPRSAEAGLKYFLFGSFTSGLFLYGLSLLFGFADAFSLRLQTFGYPSYLVLTVPYVVALIALFALSYRARPKVIAETLEPLPEAYRSMIELRIEGYEVAEITEKVRRSKRTVERVLQGFRTRLEALIHEDHPG